MKVQKQKVSRTVGFVALTMVAGWIIAPDLVMAQGLSAKASFSVGAAAPKGSVPDDAAPKTSGFEEIEAKVGNMQESIKDAAAKFDAAVNASAQDRVNRLDAVIATVETALKEVGTDGQLYLNVDKAIKVAEEKQKVWKDKSNDPKISGKTREQYDGLARRFETQVSSLYDRKILLTKVRDDLEGKRRELVENKDLVVDLMVADELAMANTALTQVIDSIQGVTKAIDDFAGKMTTEDSGTEVKDQN